MEHPLAALLRELASGQEGQPLFDEDALRMAVAARLEADRWVVEQQVACAVGEADVVATRGNRVLVIEVKRHLTRKQVFAATGQVLSYRAAIAHHAEAVVVGYATPQTETATRAVAALVAVIALPPPPPIPSSFSPHPSSLPASPSLIWAVQELAYSRGIDNPARLARRAGLARQGVYAIWDGEAKQISLRVLGRLAIALEAEPGRWFAWKGEENARKLTWDVARIASTRGLTVARLARESGLHHKMIGRIWTAVALDTQLPTLAKLALVLGEPGRPLDIGQLFAWRRSSTLPDHAGSPATEE